MSTGHLELLVGEIVEEGVAEVGFGATTKNRRSTNIVMFLAVYAVLKLDIYCLFMHVEDVVREWL